MTEKTTQCQIVWQEEWWCNAFPSVDPIEMRTTFNCTELELRLVQNWEGWATQMEIYMNLTDLRHQKIRHG